MMEHQTVLEYVKPHSQGGRAHDPHQLAEVLASVTELNEQFLAALAESARSDGPFPLASSLRGPMAALTVAQCRQAARSGVFFADAGFSDLNRWLHHTRASHAASFQENQSPWIPMGQSAVLTYAVLMVAWHIVHSSPAVAGILLGMTAPVVTVYRELGVGELSHIAKAHSGWIQPRWRERTDVWAGVIEAATQQRSGESSSALLRCLKASANHSMRLIASVETHT